MTATVEVAGGPAAPPVDGLDGQGGHRPIGSRSRWLWVWMLCCLGALVGTFLLGTMVRSPWESAIDNSRVEPSVIVAVEQRSLGGGRTEVPGVVSEGVEDDVVSDGDVASVVTGAGKAVGDTLMPGQVLAEISGRPLVALPLPFPMYRDLLPGSSGADVEAVQRALAGLGLYAARVDGAYGPETADAITALYAGAGVAPPAPAAEALAALDAAEDGSTAAGRAVREAEAGLTSALMARTAAQQNGEPTATLDVAVSQAEAARAAAVDDRAEADQDRAAARLGVMTPLPTQEIVRVPSAGAVVVDVAAVGTRLGGDVPSVARLRSGEPTVSLRVSVAEAPGFTAGSVVAAAAMTDRALVADATVTSVSEFRSSGTPDGRPPGYDVTVALPAGHPFSGGQAVVVTPSTDPPSVEGLAVPVIAVREDAAGSYVLLDAAGTGGGDDGRETLRVDVTVVAIADGYAIVEGDRIVEGVDVVVSGTP